METLTLGFQTLLTSRTSLPADKTPSVSSTLLHWAPSQPALGGGGGDGGGGGGGGGGLHPSQVDHPP